VWRITCGDSFFGLIPSVPEAPVGESERGQRAQDVQPSDRKQRIAEAGGQLVAAVVRLLGELLPHCRRVSDRGARSRFPTSWPPVAGRELLSMSSSARVTSSRVTRGES
jgi:hypothetical protein